MPVLESTLLLLFAVALSVVAADLLRLPLALLQIALGFVLAPLAHPSDISDPALFMTLFVAPLLFVDAYLAPRKELLRLRGAISLMAFGLVGFTVCSVGFFIHWLIPEMPLPVSFALAAVLSPTDAVALMSSLRGVRPPGPLLHVLEGEALLNDAAGLVCFRFAVVAAATGTFSWGDAATTLLRISVGGVLTGACLAFAVAHVELWIQRKTGPLPASQVLLGLLLPFGSYMLAERLHCSGILSAVAAGFVLSWMVRGILAPATRDHGLGVIEMLQMTFNGLIFVFLGARLPSIVNGFQNDDLPSPMHVGFNIILITAALILIRMAWAWITLRSLRHSDPALRIRSAWTRYVGFFGFAGVRGALTLASILSLPVAIATGVPLPTRELAIVLAAGVILLSLTAAPVVLPLLAQSGSLKPLRPEQGAVRHVPLGIRKQHKAHSQSLLLLVLSFGYLCAR